MLNRYFDFINEQLILESDVVFSDKFRKILTKIEHPISTQLLDIENKDFDVRNNFFDVEFNKNDKVSFIPDAKAQKILASEERFFRFAGHDGGWLTHRESNKSLFDKLGYEPDKMESVDEETGEVVMVDTPKPYNPNSTETGKEVSRVTSESSGKTYVYLQFENGKGVYNIDKLREVDEGINKVWSKDRQEIKVGKGVRAILKSANVEVDAKDLEDFVNSFKALMDRLNDKFSLFEEVKGDDISYWYKYTNYFERKGTLGGSCMSNVPSRFFDIYVKNPETCSLVIFKSQDDDSKIMARALLWTLRDGKKFMDRIYTINDSDVQLFKDYAKENGWYVKRYNDSSESNHVISPEGSEVRLSMIVDVENGDYGSYPYLDTLKYYNPDHGTLSTNSTGNTYRLESTDGHAINCEYCNGSGTVTCSDCDGDGERNCNNCEGDGGVSCSDCNGYGDIECSHCDGEGTTENDLGEEEECSNCNGRGREDCSTCDGNGDVDCDGCSGRGEHECEECNGRGEVDCYECS